MSDQLTDRRPAGSRRGLRAPVLLVTAMLAAYAVVGAAAGWLWRHLWSPSTGVVFKHAWYADSAGLRGDFSGTGLYVVVGVAAGAGLGIAVAFAGARRPMLTLGAVVLSSAVAAWLMLAVGQSMSPTPTCWPARPTTARSSPVPFASAA
jgi:hypothetical protein